MLTVTITTKRPWFSPQGFQKVPPIDVSASVSVAPFENLHHQTPVEEFDPIFVKVRSQSCTRPFRGHGIADLRQADDAVLSAEANSYHLMSRAIEGRFVFDELGKERFRELLEAHAEMAGIEVFTWCCMSNHFHLLVQVPNAKMGRAALDDEEILRRLSLVMKKERLREARQLLEEMKVQSPNRGYREYRKQFLARMFEVSVFMRELKQRFAQWHNKRVRRKGPLFDDRFKSVLLEDDATVLLTMAAYIDLNPVRTGLVRDPKDYRWSGYGEAVAGKAIRRAGLMRVYGEETGDGREWKRYQAWYRSALYGTSEERDSPHPDPVGRGTGGRRIGVSLTAAERGRRQRSPEHRAGDARARALFHGELGVWKPGMGE